MVRRAQAYMNCLELSTLERLLESGTEYLPGCSFLSYLGLGQVSGACISSRIKARSISLSLRWGNIRCTTYLSPQKFYISVPVSGYVHIGEAGQLDSISSTNSPGRCFIWCISMNTDRRNYLNLAAAYSSATLTLDNVVVQSD